MEMEIVEKYSHLNGEEYLIVHHNNTYQEIKNVIEKVCAEDFKNKVSKEKTMTGKLLYNPEALNVEFKRLFNESGWNEKRYSYCVTTNYSIMQELITLPFEKQKEYLVENGITSPITSYKQTDFVKNGIAIEVQFGKYAFVAYDLFVKHLAFYIGDLIDVGVEILPMKTLQKEMSSGVAYYEGELYNVIRQGRGVPAVPLVLIGVKP